MQSLENCSPSKNRQVGNISALENIVSSRKLLKTKIIIVMANHQISESINLNAANYKFPFSATRSHQSPVGAKITRH